jgi:O-antigen/teichoic acid export membrane protein
MRETSIRANIIANLAGKAWTSVMGLVFIPLYIKFMGIEAYGLIGIFVSLTTLFTILDMGLSSTLSRELARLSMSRDSEQESRDLVRTLETVYWGVGIMIGVTLVVLAPLIAQHWIRTERIPSETVQQAIMIMGLIVAVQWPVGLYEGGLVGLQQQVLLNSMRVSMATIQHGGAVLALWLISPTILTYFTWQIFVGMVQVVLLANCLWKSLPGTGNSSVFRKTLLKKNWKFAAGMMSISVTSIILTQTDKIVLSRMLSLTLFGYYALAFNGANSLSLLVNPVCSALFPKLSQLNMSKDSEDIVSDYYHKGCQVVSIVIFPAACVLALFSHQILLLWVRDPIIAQNADMLFSALVMGSLLNAVMTMPFTLQLAYGWTKLSFSKNVIAVIVLVPLMIWLTNLYGAFGAAVVWILLNGGYFVIEIPIMHSRVLKRDMWRWYFQDVGMPFCFVLIVVLLSRIFMPHIESFYLSLTWILVTGLLAILSAMLAVPFAREWFKRGITLWRHAA